MTIEQRALSPGVAAVPAALLSNPLF